ncbi:hypothetical protein [Nonomuraea insulae]|uniref:Uncharacterized protein n=1 Tax=Nonomuraea insulae TaxID=1616787 RepID=A0ABW1D3U4_9ACTN
MGNRDHPVSSTLGNESNARSPDAEKLYSWLEYIANFRAREKCPACLVVICPNTEVARWAQQEIYTGHPGLILKVLAIHRGNTPVITDVGQARSNIVLAAISAVTQSEHPRFKEIAAAVQEAMKHIDESLAYRYARYINLSLEGDAQAEWNRGMQTMKYPYQGEYSESLLAEGRVEGEARSVLKILDVRGLAVSEEVRKRIMDCREQSLLDVWLQRAIKVQSVEELFD